MANSCPYGSVLATFVDSLGWSPGNSCILTLESGESLVPWLLRKLGDAVVSDAAAPRATSREVEMRMMPIQRECLFEG